MGKAVNYLWGEIIMNRYKVILSDDGYIVGAYITTGDDYDFEGSLSEYPDISRGWYKLDNGLPIIDVERKADILNAEIKALEKEELVEELSSTDEAMMELLEDFLSLTNPLTFATDFANLVKKYSNLISTRKALRQRINELRSISALKI